LLGEVSYVPNTGAETSTFGRYVGNTTEANAKEFQKRTFFYAQDTWRATRKLTFNLGLRWELYFPESVNAAGNGALLNLNDGYLHVAGIGNIPSDMGWTIDKRKQFAPRVGVSYQLNPKTVIRAGYGRSFDMGVFGSIFGHTVTQNLPVLANQSVSAATNYETAFTLSQGPPPNIFPTVPASGLLPNPGALVTSKVRQSPLTFPTIDAWNGSVQRALTSTLALTVALVGNKGTHTLGDGDSRNTNPNEAAINLPASYSYNGQALHYDPTVTAAAGAAPINTATGATSSTNLLQRYYGLSLPACRDANYTSPGSGYSNITLPPGACGWTQSIFYQGDNQNTEYDALQVTLAQTLSKGLAYNVNYNYAGAWDENTTYWTWSKSAAHERDSNVRNQQVVLYGSYDLPFGRNRQFVSGANRATDLLIGGFQLSDVLNWSGGLPFSVTYNEATANVPSSAPNYPSAAAGVHMKTNLTGFTAGGAGTGTRTYYSQQIPCAHTGCTPGANGSLTNPTDVAAGTGVFVNPGLDNIGSVGWNTYRGPHFFTSDMAVTKAFTIRENVVAKFRMDAFNVFNHINPGNPGGGIESVGAITSEANGCVGSTCGPRQLEFSLRVQF
jgi:hypothetical protein